MVTRLYVALLFLQQMWTIRIYFVRGVVVAPGVTPVVQAAMTGQAELLMAMANSNQAWKSRFEGCRKVDFGVQVGCSRCVDNV